MLARSRESKQADSLLALGDTLIWTGARGRYDESGGVMVGRPPNAPGNGFTVSVGSEFGVPEMEEVYRRLVALEDSGGFAQFTCPGDSVPRFTFRMILKGAGEYSERLVYFGYRPELQSWGNDRCLNLGADYLVARTFAEVDTGPSVDYGYQNPSTGKRIAPQDPGERHARWRPICRCELRDQDNEWAKSGPIETTLGPTARDH